MKSVFCVTQSPKKKEEERKQICTCLRTRQKISPFRVYSVYYKHRPMHTHPVNVWKGQSAKN